jgi:hypothetical protein
VEYQLCGGGRRRGRGSSHCLPHGIRVLKTCYTLRACCWRCTAAYRTLWRSVSSVRAFDTISRVRRSARAAAIPNRCSCACHTSICPEYEPRMPPVCLYLRVCMSASHLGRCLARGRSVQRSVPGRLGRVGITKGQLAPIVRPGELKNERMSLVPTNKLPPRRPVSSAVCQCRLAVPHHPGSCQ